MITDMMTTGFTGTELANISFGDSVAVIGIGPVGLMAVAASTLQGAGRLFGIGSRTNCANLAREYGATDIINYKNGDIVDQILDVTSGAGVDKVILAGGNANVLSQAIKIVKPGGIISNVNYFDKEDLIIPRLDWGCGMSNKTIRGGLCCGGRYRMEQLINLILNKRIDPGKLVTHVLHGIDKIEDGLTLMYNKPKDLIKPVVLID
jgi:isopropanol dehydrogenase (NADP+)